MSTATFIRNSTHPPELIPVDADAYLRELSRRVQPRPEPPRDGNPKHAADWRPNTRRPKVIPVSTSGLLIEIGGRIHNQP